MSTASPITIRVVPPDHRAAAIRYLMGDTQRAERTRSGPTAYRDEGAAQVPQFPTAAPGIPASSAAALGSIWSGLLEARRGDAMAGAVWGRIRPGHTAEVIPPRLVDGEDQATADGLLIRLNELFRAEQIRAAYAYLPPASQSTSAAGYDPASTAAPHCSGDLPVMRDRVADVRMSIRSSLSRQGYQHVTDVLLLARGLNQLTWPAERDVLTYAPCCPSEREQLVKVLAATQVDSLDFPSLGTILTSEDLVAGFEVAGDSGWRLWRMAKHQGQPVGCLLLADHADRQRVELLYLGLVPSARGRGWGRKLVRTGLQLAGELGREQVVLAVDASNDPAITTYSSESFDACVRHEVWLQTF